MPPWLLTHDATVRPCFRHSAWSISRCRCSQGVAVICVVREPRSGKATKAFAPVGLHAQSANRRPLPPRRWRTRGSPGTWRGCPQASARTSTTTSSWASPSSGPPTASSCKPRSSASASTTPARASGALRSTPARSGPSSCTSSNPTPCCTRTLWRSTSGTTSLMAACWRCGRASATHGPPTCGALPYALGLSHCTGSACDVCACWCRLLRGTRSRSVPFPSCISLQWSFASPANGQAGLRSSG